MALFHHHTLQVALTGLAVITLYKLGFTGFKDGPGPGRARGAPAHEWVILTNLLGLLLGFALLSKHFEESRMPAVLPHFLPDDWKGGFVLLVMIFVLSSFLDNIAAALIGGTIARTVFRRKVHIGYLAAIVAASNAGGSGSVVGDTTTTMMWIDGVSPLRRVRGLRRRRRRAVDFRHPGRDAAAALFADHQGRAVDAPRRLGAGRHRGLHPASPRSRPTCSINVKFPQYADRFPFIGAAVWAAMLLAAPWRRPDWKLLPEASRAASSCSRWSCARR